jgi:hypothetical protein
MAEALLTERTEWHRIGTLVVALIGLFFCYRLFLTSATVGISRLYSTAAIIQSRVEPSDEAVRLTPNDPEAHYTRALTLINMERLPDAVAELREATRLRPHHYYEWLDLGVTLDRLGDQAGAETALRNSIALAPAFAQPHWQLGNMLFRNAQYPEAFDQLRRGASSSPNLTQDLFRLAWVAGGEDIPTFLSIAQPITKTTHFEAAKFLASQGKGDAALAQLHEAGEATNDQERSLLKQSVQLLLSSGQFFAAFEAWKLAHPEAAKNVKNEQIVNGDFLDSIPLADAEFGWQLLPSSARVLTIDMRGPTEDGRSLRIEFAGDNAPSTTVARQLVLLQPDMRYSLSFMAKAGELVTGGPPVIVVLGNSSNGSSPKILGQSAALALGTTEWTRYAFEFTTDSTGQVLINIQRQPCSEVPCPVFGKLWLGKFSLTRAG